MQKSQRVLFKSFSGQQRVICQGEGVVQSGGVVREMACPSVGAIDDYLGCGIRVAFC